MQSPLPQQNQLSLAADAAAKNDAKTWKTWLAILLAGGFLLQMALAALTEGYRYDMSCFFAWALRMAEVGPAGFYADGYFCDYPPAYLLLLGLVGRSVKALHLVYTARAARLLLCFFPAAASCGIAALVFFIGKKHLAPAPAFRLAAFAMSCPVLLYDTAIWKQIDAVFALPVLLCFFLLSEKKYLPAAVFFGLSLAVKPQAFLAGPVLAAAFCAPLLEKQITGARGIGTIKNLVLGAVLALAVPLASGLPFFGVEQLFPRLAEIYLGTTSSYPYASINACNWMTALGGNWKPQTERFLVLSWQQWGILAICLLTVALAVLTVKSSRAGRFCPLLMAAFYTVGVFTFSHRMHERYLIFGILLTLAAAARWGDKRLFGAAAGFSLTSLINLAEVYAAAGSNDEWLSGDVPALMMRICGMAQTACFLLLAWAVIDLAVSGAVHPLTIAGEKAVLQPQPQPKWLRGEKIFLVLLTVGTAAVSLWNLGDFTAPQNPLDATNESVSVAVRVQGEAAELWVYPGVSTDGLLLLFDDSGTELAEVSLSYGNPFSWQRIALPSASATGNYSVVVSNARVMELAFCDAAGQRLALSAEPDGRGAALFDEQALVPESISYRNSTYFDEIYHARTGYELGHRMEVYETTHPPLGKDFIMLGIALFGMTGFGWRVSGAVFGILMVPVFVLLVRRITRNRRLAALGGALLAMDGLRFVQSRIATIDVYATFFILLSAYLMMVFAQKTLQRGVHHALLPLGLCGVSFGLGCASKWTGIYAGAVLAALFFGTLWMRGRQKPKTFAHEFWVAILGGCVFFVAVPLAIYLASYLPYWWRDPAFSLADWVDCQKYMYWYHSSLEATHPFESRWYTWPLMLRPVWYYAGGGLANGSAASIAAIGNPVVFWGGAAGMMALGWRQLSGQGSRAGGAVCVLYLGQILPWVLVSRCTFLYHYFPGMLFALLAMLCVLQASCAPGGVWAGRGRAIGITLAVMAAAWFLLFYPVLSGLTVPSGYLGWLRWLPGWGW